MKLILTQWSDASTLGILKHIYLISGNRELSAYSSILWLGIDKF